MSETQGDSTQPFSASSAPSLHISVDGSVLGLVTLCVSQTRPINSPVGREIMRLTWTPRCSVQTRPITLSSCMDGYRIGLPRDACIFSNTTCLTPRRNSNTSPDPILLLGISKLPSSHIPTRAAQLDVEPTPA